MGFYKLAESHGEPIGPEGYEKIAVLADSLAVRQVHAEWNLLGELARLNSER